jgi:hypothetical protein
LVLLFFRVGCLHPALVEKGPDAVVELTAAHADDLRELPLDGVGPLCEELEQPVAGIFAQGW